VTLDFVNINQEHPDTLAGSNNAENTQEGGVAGHNTAVSATNRSIFAIEDNPAGAVLNGRSNVMLSGLVLDPEPFLPQLPPFAAVPQFPFAASSSEVLPAMTDANPMFKIMATVEYEETTCRTKRKIYFIFRTSSFNFVS
jgi:hypothetical protein